MGDGRQYRRTGTADRRIKLASVRSKAQLGYGEAVHGVAGDVQVEVRFLS